MSLQSDDFDGYLKECDALIRGGQISLVAARIRALNLAQVDGAHRLELARICRRVGLVNAGLRLLTPVVRGEKLLIQPTVHETCEYSALLSRVGLAQEALTLLQTVDSIRAPEAELFRGFCHIMRWDYAKAIVPLKKFILSAADPYQAQIARVNLAASYVATGQHSEARDLLDGLIDQLAQRKAQRLIGNCLELRAQTWFHQGRLDTCLQDLRAAEDIFVSTDSYDQLLVRKWLAYLSALKTKTAAPLMQFKAEAFKRKHWESVRDADLFALKVEFNQAQFDHLYFGTPFAAYRERILAEVRGEPSSHYDFGGANSRHLDILTGEIHGAAIATPSPKIHHLIGTLLKDFYLPARVGTLFSELYPGEYFDIHSSPMRVRQVMRRLRRWLESSGVPLTIETVSGTFRLKSGGPFSVRLPLPGLTIGAHSSDVEKLKTYFQIEQKFLADEACAKLGLSRSSFYRLAERMIISGELRRLGVGKSTRYARVQAAEPLKAAA